MTGSLHELQAQAAAADIALHSLEVSLAGRTLVRTGVAPFGPDVPHRMYSVSKSFTGVAILLLAEEERLNLADSIAAHFPEMHPVHPWLAATTIDDMLAMTGPHSRTTYVEKSGAWLPSYFRVPPTHRPGTLFTYDTSASYTLAALVERLSGQPLLEYLRPRLLDPLGVGVGARFRTGPEGIAHGGSGLVMAPGDLIPIAETINGRGLRAGRRILPERVVDRLLARRSDPGTQTWGAALRAGYGRQIWLPGGKSWLMFGLGGQIVYGDPERELAAVVTADTTTLTGGDQRLVDLLLRALADPDLAHAPAVELAPPTPPHVAANAVPTDAEAIRDTGEDAPETVVVRVDAAGGRIAWDGEHDLRFSTAGPAVGPTPLGDTVMTAGWSATGVLDVRASAVCEDIASVRVRLVRTDDGTLTIMSQGFGPEIDASWTWRGSFRL